MKLRLEKNSVRFRIRKSELQQLKEYGFIKESVAFPDAVFMYELRVTDTSSIQSSLAHNTIVFELPLALASNWMNTDEVGIYASVMINNQQALELIVEKDFPCKDRPGEDKSDTFTELADESGKDKAC